jgi:hypothetical protein
MDTVSTSPRRRAVRPSFERRRSAQAARKSSPSSPDPHPAPSFSKLIVCLVFRDAAIENSFENENGAKNRGLPVVPTMVKNPGYREQPAAAACTSRWQVM